MLNTIKSSLRFTGSVIRKYSLIKSKENSIEDILNYINYNDVFSSSGQPTKAQFTLIKEAGYGAVINLAPYDFIENPLKGEADIVTGLGMEYTHIPVHMFNPTKEDFDKFVSTMQAASASGKKVWVHCAINMRGSAFSYRYRCSVLGEDKEKAIWDLREIWEPFGTFRKFTFDDSTAA